MRISSVMIEMGYEENDPEADPGNSTRCWMSWRASWNLFGCTTLLSGEYDNTMPFSV